MTTITLPESPNTVREMMLQYHAEKKAEVVCQIRVMKAKGGKFSVSLDEWTSGANRRYMNVNLHTVGKFWNLGLARVRGSFTADACKLLLEARLSDFEVQLSDVFAIATDGAATMKKFGKLTKRNHVICMAHAIHLAVVSVLYKCTKPLADSINGDTCEEDEENIYSFATPLMEQSGLEEQSENDSDFEEESEAMYSDTPISETPDVECEMNSTLGQMISNVRKTVRTFRNSALKTEVLMKYSVGATKLIIDVKTRWNSLLAMLERVSSLKDSIRKAMIDLNEPLLLTDNDFIKIDEIIESKLSNPSSFLAYSNNLPNVFICIWVKSS